MKLKKMNGAGKIYWVSRFLYLKKIPLLPRILMYINRIVFSCDLPYTADIHPTVGLGHNALGIIIHPQSVVGENSQIMQHVTLGANRVGGNRNLKRIHEKNEFSCPIIGKGVFIGPGAMLFGPILIGDNATIAASAVVFEDVPSNATAVGIPAKILSN